MQTKVRQIALRTSMLYGGIAVLWILLSDRLLAVIVSDPEVINRLQTFIGLAFVTVTALLFYATLGDQLQRWEREVNERKRAEEALEKGEKEARRLAEENALMAEIGRIISSTFNINEVYALFSAKVKSVLPYDRIAINLVNKDGATLVNCYVEGDSAPGRNPGDVFPMAGTLTEEMIRTRKGSIIAGQNKDEMAGRYPALLPEIKAGFRSFLSVPLISGDKAVGGLHFRSKSAEIYSEKDLMLAESIANQIAGTVANSQLYAERIQAERERVLLEEQLLQSQKVEAIGTLAGGIAHDFNNILAAILGYAELANLEMTENSKAKDNLQNSMKAAHRARDLVQHLLSFSRQGRQERKPLDIRPIIKEGLKFLRASLPATIEIRENLEEDLGPIAADPTQVHQVLMNLSTNAAHAMDENGGVLEVSLTRFDLDGVTSAASLGIDPGSYVRLQVRDTGHGMSPEILKRIFDPYFTTKEVGKGTGLGLAVVHGIVKSYGGGVVVSSEVGKGSRFDVYFPKLKAHDLPLEADGAEVLPLGSREKVLFVDDEEAVVEIGRETLEYLGYDVTIRTSSTEALELFRVQGGRFDLVITDMTMPNMTGDKLAQELLRIRPGIPIILCTGFSEHMTKEKAMTIGIREFAMKPLVMKELAKAIRRALSSRDVG